MTDKNTAAQQSGPASDSPRVSIIMNVRDGAAYVGDALASVAAQTCRDWEIIFWDNASNDATAEIAGTFNDPRKRYFREPLATPLARARELAIQQARGEWLAFLDHDDVWLPDKLELQLALAQSDPTVAIVYGRALSFSADGNERDFDHRHEFEPLPQGDIFERLFTDSCFVAMSSAMLRRAAVIEAGPIPDWIDVIPDYFLYLELARRYRARAVQRVVCRYRLHPASLSYTAGRTMHVEALRLLERWAGAIAVGLLAKRRRIHSTGLAVEEMRRPGLRIQGAMRLVRKGSLAYLLSRPLAWLYRAFRRRIHLPIWKQDGAAAVWRGAPARDERHPLKLSVIVVNWKVRDLLRECLVSLHGRMRLPRDAWELIVVDNASDDGSVEMLRAEFPDAVLIANRDNVGFGRANNQAFGLCRGRHVLLLNPDTIVLDHSVDRMLEIMDRSPDIGALGCQLLNTDGSFQRWTGGNPPRLRNVACHFLLLYRLFPQAILPPPLYLESEPSRDIEVGWVSGACMMLRRQALGVSIFDERFFMYGEDLELCDRLHMGEWKVVYTPTARIVHHEGQSLARQTVEVQQSKMRGLRVVFAMRNSPVLLPAYDCLLLAGFAIRLFIYSIAAVLRPNRGYAARVTVSRRCAGEALDALLRRS